MLVAVLGMVNCPSRRVGCTRASPIATPMISAESQAASVCAVSACSGEPPPTGDRSPRSRTSPADTPVTSSCPRRSGANAYITGNTFAHATRYEPLTLTLCRWDRSSIVPRNRAVAISESTSRRAISSDCLPVSTRAS
jgi:hypothetical protein